MFDSHQVDFDEVDEPTEVFEKEEKIPLKDSKEGSIAMKKEAEIDTFMTNISLYFDEKSCVGCGICEEVCPKEAIKLGPTGAVKRGVTGFPTLSIDESKCSLCGICDAVCPFNALRLEINGERRVPIVDDLKQFPRVLKVVRHENEKCKLTKKCIDACPTGAISIENGDWKIDTMLCNTCPWCEDACPNHAIHVEKMINGGIEIDVSKCPGGCEVCLNICPTKAIYKPKAEKPWEIVDNIAVNDRYCIYCGACAKNCPVDAIIVKRKEIKIKPLQSTLVWNQYREKLVCKKYKIIAKREIAPNIISLDIAAPLIAERAKPGQFIILATDEKGERIPLTIADYNRENGWIRIVFQVVGKTTAQLSQMKEGGELFSLVGPLGNPSEINNYGTVVTVGGGTGIACVYPITRELKEAGNRVIAIIGAKTKDLIIMEEGMRESSTDLLVTTDDGSYARKGFVTAALDEVLRREKDVKKVWVIGPAPMMKAACDVTKPHRVETIVSLNAVMVDGTGMCGSCRVTVGGETKFVCVDGPEFNGHLVNWPEFMNRLARYDRLEKISVELYRKQQKEVEKNG